MTKQREIDLKQSELDLVQTTKLPEGFVLPLACVVVYKWQRQKKWRTFQKKAACGFGCMDDEPRYYDVQGQGDVVVGPEILAVTFDEVSVKKFVKSWTEKNGYHESDSEYMRDEKGNLRKDQFWTWLTYEKVEFQTGNGIAMIPDAAQVEIEKEHPVTYEKEHKQ